MTTSTLTRQERWNAALKEARKNGVKIRQNIKGCCKGCIDLESIFGDTETVAYGWTYGSQNSGYKWSDNGKVLNDDERYLPSPITRVPFNHSNGAGQVIADAFKAHGFKVEWVGSNLGCVIVYPND